MPGVSRGLGHLLGDAAQREGVAGPGTSGVLRAPSGEGPLPSLPRGAIVTSEPAGEESGGRMVRAVDGVDDRLAVVVDPAEIHRPSRRASFDQRIARPKVRRPRIAHAADVHNANSAGSLIERPV